MKTTPPNPVNGSLTEAVAAAVAKHGRDYSAFIPILLEVNRALGYLPAQALREIRRHLHEPAEGIFVHEGQLYALSSFYHMLSTTPLGRHVILFCESAPCHVEGGREVWQALQEHLGLKAGETSPDGRWSLLTTSCLGICGVGPVVVVDGEVHGNVTPQSLPHILARYA